MQRLKPSISYNVQTLFWTEMDCKTCGARSTATRLHSGKTIPPFPMSNASLKASDARVGPGNLADARSVAQRSAPSHPNHRVYNFHRRLSANAKSVQILRHVTTRTGTCQWFFQVLFRQWVFAYQLFHLQNIFRDVNGMRLEFGLDQPHLITVL